MLNENKIEILKSLLEEAKDYSYVETPSTDELIEILEEMIDMYSNCQFTDAEQRIFLSAMAKESVLCMEIDEDCGHKEESTVNLSSICNSIIQKVKKYLWNRSVRNEVHD